MLRTVGAASSPCRADTLSAMSTRSCAVNHWRLPQPLRKAFSSPLESGASRSSRRPGERQMGCKLS
eukprot:2987720-Alexandrium_andersonii.AAC.1